LSHYFYSFGGKEDIEREKSFLGSPEGRRISDMAGLDPLFSVATETVGEEKSEEREKRGGKGGASLRPLCYFNSPLLVAESHRHESEKKKGCGERKKEREGRPGGSTLSFSLCVCQIRDEGEGKRKSPLKRGRGRDGGDLSLSNPLSHPMVAFEEKKERKKTPRKKEIDRWCRSLLLYPMTASRIRPEKSKKKEKQLRKRRGGGRKGQGAASLPSSLLLRSRMKRGRRRKGKFEEERRGGKSKMLFPPS